MTDLPKKGIAITGCGRSGTSFLIKVLHANGVSVGRCTGGTLENLEVRAINDSYLANNFKAIKNSQKPYGVLPDDEISVNAEAQQNSKQVINNLKSISSNYWAFKDPRTTVLHDMWLKHVDVVVGVFRNPHEVAESYMKLLGVYFNDSSRDQGYEIMLNYWLRFNQSLLYIFENTDKPKFMLEFNNNINEQVVELFDFLELPKHNNSNDFNPSLKHENKDLNFSNSQIEETYNKLLKLKNV
tara:strand:- start:188 stop:910 length:723 start_codon:yes stop_codon:yes gene_type:complete